MARQKPTSETADISRRLRLVRESSGLSKADFARLLGVSWQRWNNYEADSRRVPALDVLVSLHRKLGISLDWLLCGTGAARLPAQVGDPAALARANLAKAKLK
jgi:transcriptional regulator with XRE-family HTH domain